MTDKGNNEEEEDEEDDGDEYANKCKSNWSKCNWMADAPSLSIELKYEIMWEEL